MTTAPFEPGTDPAITGPGTDAPNPVAPGEEPAHAPEPEPQPTES